MSLAYATPSPLRAGSVLEKAQIVLREAGTPLHINTIIERLNGGFTQNQRNGLVGSLSSYAKKRRVFTKTAPNTFGLIELQDHFTKNPPETIRIAS